MFVQLDYRTSILILHDLVSKHAIHQAFRATIYLDFQSRSRIGSKLFNEIKREALTMTTRTHLTIQQAIHPLTTWLIQRDGLWYFQKDKDNNWG